jgi:hypothetical protein
MSYLIQFPKKKLSKKHRTIDKMAQDFIDEGFSDEPAVLAATILYDVIRLENRILKLEKLLDRSLT